MSLCPSFRCKFRKSRAERAMIAFRISSISTPSRAPVRLVRAKSRPLITTKTTISTRSTPSRQRASVAAVCVDAAGVARDIIRAPGIRLVSLLRAFMQPKLCAALTSLNSACPLVESQVLLLAAMPNYRISHILAGIDSSFHIHCACDGRRSAPGSIGAARRSRNNAVECEFRVQIRFLSISKFSPSIPSMACKLRSFHFALHDQILRRGIARSSVALFRPIHFAIRRPRHCLAGRVAAHVRVATLTRRLSGCQCAGAIRFQLGCIAPRSLARHLIFFFAHFAGCCAATQARHEPVLHK